MKLIDADELIKKIKALNRAVNKASLIGRGKRRAYEEMINTVVEMPAAPKWTFFEDEKPKKAGNYIVAFYRTWGGVVNKDRILLGVTYWRGKEGWSRHTKQDIIAWIPAPKPPKEVADEQDSVIQGQD